MTLSMLTTIIFAVLYIMECRTSRMYKKMLNDIIEPLESIEERK